jgi:hypothetical protein
MKTSDNIQTEYQLRMKSSLARTTAIGKNEKTYISAKPCNNCDNKKRYTVSRTCVYCAKQNTTERTATKAIKRRISIADNIEKFGDASTGREINRSIKKFAKITKQSLYVGVLPCKRCLSFERYTKSDNCRLCTQTTARCVTENQSTIEGLDKSSINIRDIRNTKKHISVIR